MTAAVNVRPASSAEDWAEARALVTEYVTFLDVDLAFQNIADELAALADEYAAPDGTFLLAVEDGIVLGCVALRRFDDADGEMKRLWVRPAGRGKGLGRRLATAIVEEARARGYRRILLDTLPKLEEAIGLYRALGFEEIAPYTFNPLPGVKFFGLALRVR